MELDEAIQSRKSVRKFNSKKPDWRDIIECIDAARYAPMAGANYSLKFIIVDKLETIQKLADAAQQDFVSKAQYVVVVCTNPSRTINSFEERGKIYCRQQAGAAIENFLLKIQEKGLSTCWVGLFVDNLVKRALKIPEDINVEAMFPIGYEYSKTKPKNKIDLDRILYFNEYKNKKMNSPKKLNV
ncbi:MAG: nitroreductase family protein [archaeon]